MEPGISLTRVREIAERHGILYWEVPELEDDTIYKVLRGEEESPVRIGGYHTTFAERLAALELQYQQAMAKQGETNKHLVEEIERLRAELAEHTGGLKHV